MCENKNQSDEFVRNPCEEDDPQNVENPADEKHFEQIEDSGSILTSRGDNVIHCLTIIGQIEGHYILPQNNKTTKYEHVIPLLVSIDEDPRIDGLLILLNTVGGDVEAGLAIAELISGMRKPTVSIVLGGGHSIGIPLAVAAKRSFIAKSASMTAHPVRSTGLTIGVPQTFEYYQRMQDRITNFVVDNSKISKEDYTALVMNTGELVMDVGTILDGQRAVDLGLVDSVGTLTDATDCLYAMIDESKKTS
ncbi:MAG: ATP-dependent Clp protease proteolytic subunit [Ruminococcus sp.]|nr:ATP-dependent Clp protease proteolytic subunit [Ruminococcus sp.]